MRPLCVLVGAALLVAPSALAQNAADGNQLLKLCAPAVAFFDNPKSVSDEAAPGASYCAGFVDGVSSMNEAYSGAKAKPFFCVPDPVVRSQMIRVLVDHLKNHPERLHEPNIVLAIHAFREAWPCSGARESKRP